MASTASARLRPAASTFALAYIPVTPAPSMEGVLGIARTTAASPPSQRSIWAEVMPAATDTATGRSALAAACRSSQTPRITCGLTANIHTPAPCTASAAVWNVATPKSCCSPRRVDSLGAATRIVPGSVPLAIRPPIRLRAMLPPPMNAMAAGGAGSVAWSVMSCSRVRAPYCRRAPCAVTRYRAQGTLLPGKGLAGRIHGRRWIGSGAGFVTQVGGYTAGGEYAWAAPGAARVRIDTAVQGTRMDIAELLAFSVKNKASDLHLSAGLPPMIRVDGDVRRINVPALDHKQVHALVYDIMSDKQRRDYEEFLEVDFSFEIPGLARFRVNAFNQNRGAGAVFRTVPSEVLTLEDLGTPAVFRQLIDQPQGLILVTGPTGSGKSTTLAAMVDHINKNEYGHILTIEDPIEFVHTAQKCLINQREVHRDTHGFNEALRSALREDPDYILVGELRDLETIRLALTAAETGHLVFATVHTSSAAKTIDRIIDVFPAGEKPMVRSMLSESLRAVISQALLKKVGGGRTAAWEIMVGTPAIRNLIREDKVAQMYSAIQTGQSAGMMTLDQHLQDLVKRGLVTRAQAKDYAKDKRLFE